MSYAFTDDLPDFPGGVAGKSLMHLLGTGMHRIFLALALAILASSGFAQTPPLLPRVTVAALANEVSGETAKRTLEGLARLHRQRGSQGFHAAAELIPTPKLLSYEGSWGLGEEYAYEALNFVNGLRSVGQITAALTVEYGPFPRSWFWSTCRPWRRLASCSDARTTPSVCRVGEPRL